MRMRTSDTDGSDDGGFGDVIMMSMMMLMMTVVMKIVVRIMVMKMRMAMKTGWW